MTRVWKCMGIGLLGLVFLRGTTTVFAQSLESDSTGQIEIDSSTTEEEKRLFAEETVKEANKLYSQITSLVEEAENKGDDDLVECLTKQQALIFTMLASAETAKAGMEDALNMDPPDLARAEHLFRRLTVVRGQIQEAERDYKSICLGEDDNSYITSNDSGIGESSDTEPINDGTLDLNVGNESPGTSPFE